MYRLSFILILFSISLMAQVPHGDNFSINCDVCHTEESWQVDLTKITFDHSTTDFELLGQHKSVTCSNCHESLIFENVKTNCFECHIDIHETTLGKDCESCHNSNSWVVTNIKEIHDLSRFPLIGSHAIADCEDCHSGVSNLRFEPLGVTCFDCHNAGYAATQNPNHIASGFSTECEECHSISDNQWSLASFAHDFFPLNGGHNISNCFECHDQNTFSGLSSNCYDCHRSDYENAQAIDHVAMGFDTDCSVCHSLNPGWSPAVFATHDEFYPLVGAHAVIASDCNQCHYAGFTNTPNQCFGCHESDYNATTNPSHISANFSTNCEDCHNESAWQPATFDHDAQFFPIYSGEHNGEWNACSDCHTNSSDYSVFSCISCHEHNRNDMDDEHGGINGYVYESNACLSCHPTGSGEGGFNHSTTNFPLTGSHVSTDCQDCHVNGYQGTSTLCDDCHHDSYLTAPEHSALGFPLECEQCHNTILWQEVSFDHNNTNFPLTGSHISANCADCHTNGYQGTSTLCDDCHHENYVAAPEHSSLGYPLDCEQCHNTNAWEEATFDHNTTNFPLSGAHVGPICSDCHASGFSNTSSLCIDCHLEQFNSTTNPNHQTLGISNQCEDCHTTTPGWSPAEFPIHNDFYVLQGAHLSVPDCADCHTIDYNNTPDQCYGCHESDFNSTTDPSHQSAGFSTDCETCHTESAWSPATFDHDAQFFPIYSGEHNGEWNACSDCHSNQSNYADFTCIDCHEHNQTDTDDEHRGVDGYVYISQECFACHPTGSSEGAFNHAISNFPLTGSHITVDCQDCHTNGYIGTSSLCDDCHHENYVNAAEHSSLGFPVECEQCHNTNTWNDATFDHGTTNFPLTGSHVSVNCQDCHIAGYQNTSALCDDCHHENYIAAPEHSSLGYPLDCEQCHNTNAWQEATFDHNTTNFPLTGAHVGPICSDCHASGFSNTSSLCVDCHIEQFNGTTNPNHQTLGISSQCEDCHTSNPGWSPAEFPIHNDFYVLQGAHLSVPDCADCHTIDYNNTPDQCYGCHESDFNSTTDPSHQSAGFSTDCETCHTENAWQPATFDHDAQFFPIYSGEHRGEWNACSDCHNNQSNYADFTCIDCHEHNQSDMDDEHQGVNGYIYVSQECFACHPTGNSDGAFNHSNSNFPLTGSHTTVECSECHTSGYLGTSSLCDDCHHEDYLAAQDHSTFGYPVECEKCHTTSIWGESTFDHNSTNFPLTGAHTGQVCAGCHESGFDGISTICSDCHIENFNATTNPNHTSLGISNQCENCHSTDAGWKPASFDIHDDYFVLEGAHLSITNCTDCHTNGYININKECYGCHQTDYDETTAPSHHTLVLSQSCESCHSANSWQPSSFNHASTGFELIGGHQLSDCSSCHSTDVTQTQNVCYDCHESKYSIAPEHTTLGYPTDCEQCHNTTSWVEVTFDHSKTEFSLTGAHLNQSCNECHVQGYAGTSKLCYDCHTDNYSSSINPSHQTLALSQTCEECHSTDAWSPSDFNHSTTGFELVGGHQITDCSSCHTSDVKTAQNVCNDCHNDDYLTAPDHSTLGFPTECDQCHNTTSWAEATFDHNTTDFPLTGAHVGPTCNACHADGFVGTSSLCVDCHISDFNNSTNPDHQNLSLANTCDDCHTTNPGWSPAEFPNHDNFYALIGAHASIRNNCNDCHNGNYNSAPNTCYQCHQNDYDSTTDPNHSAAQFPTDCEQCHSQNAWEPATFDHDGQYFPIYSGEHRGEWNACSDCHTNSSNYSVFSCIDCHEHNRSEMDSEHNDVNGYIYQSASCYNCHPDGRADDTNLPHLNDSEF